MGESQKETKDAKVEPFRFHNLSSISETFFVDVSSDWTVHRWLKVCNLVFGIQSNPNYYFEWTFKMSRLKLLLSWFPSNTWIVFSFETWAQAKTVTCPAHDPINFPGERGWFNYFSWRKKAISILQQGRTQNRELCSLARQYLTSIWQLTGLAGLVETDQFYIRSHGSPEIPSQKDNDWILNTKLTLLVQ